MRQPPLAARYGAVSFEYIGPTSLTVVGPATGRQYHFEPPGARVTIDPRDRASIASIRALRKVPEAPHRV